MAAVPMQSDPNWLVYSGHCHAILKNGPFIIGRDFDAPAPAGRALPNIKPSSNDFIKMNACLAKVVPHGNANSASERELFSDVMAEHALEKGFSGGPVCGFRANCKRHFAEAVSREIIRCRYPDGLQVSRLGFFLAKNFQCNSLFNLFAHSPCCHRADDERR